MLRSMFAGVSGLRNHQIKMDIIGNNIANVNTIGYKKSRTTFQDMLSQTLRGASSPQNNLGGTNPQQVGLGMNIGSIDTIHTGGAVQPTGKITDLAIQGDGFFILRQGQNEFYTRAGNFDFDSEGYLVNPANGLKVMGWMGDVERTPQNLSSIVITKGQPISAEATTQIEFKKNLDASAAVGETVQFSINVFDSLGNAHNIDVLFEKTNTNEWDCTLIEPGGTRATSSLRFDTSGNYDDTSSTINTLSFTPAGADTLNINPVFFGVSQYSNDTTVVADQNGHQAGTLQTISIDTLGVITGVFDNGINKQLAQIALVNFDNPAGLLKIGQNLYKNSNNSGEKRIGCAATGGRGSLTPGALEMSNVDLAEEFTEMIVTQRGFQANSRIITASDEMLQELVNLRR